MREITPISAKRDEIKVIDVRRAIKPKKRIRWGRVLATLSVLANAAMAGIIYAIVAGYIVW